MSFLRKQESRKQYEEGKTVIYVIADCKYKDLPDGLFKKDKFFWIPAYAGMTDFGEIA